MTQVFTEIKINELDDEASGPAGIGGSMCLVFKLSQSAPPRWIIYFNDAWKQTFRMMMYSAHAFDNRIEIVCLPGEFQTDHIPQLYEVIAETNAAYAGYCEEQQRIAVRQDAELNKQLDDLVHLNNSLKYD